MSSKAIQVCPAVGKEQFNYECGQCKRWRPLTRYEPANEAVKYIVAGEAPKDEERFFIGPVCSVECLRKLGNYKVVEPEIPEEEEDGREES